jgi:hypothetical protein
LPVRLSVTVKVLGPFFSSELREKKKKYEWLKKRGRMKSKRKEIDKMQRSCFKLRYIAKENIMEHVLNDQGHWSSAVETIFKRKEKNTPGRRGSRKRAKFLLAVGARQLGQDAGQTLLRFVRHPRVVWRRDSTDSRMIVLHNQS